MPLHFSTDSTPGYENVRAGADPFTNPLLAVVHHPKGSRRWHVHYLSDRGAVPVTYRTRKAMLDALDARFCEVDA